MKRILKSWLLAAALCFCVTAAAERPMLIHSHNDYCRRAPFWQAYAQGVYSIEPTCSCTTAGCSWGTMSRTFRPT
ncbi:MAG: hypothetical protein ACLRMJ_10125 [Alistipes finegoldii]